MTLHTAAKRLCIAVFIVAVAVMVGAWMASGYSPFRPELAIIIYSTALKIEVTMYVLDRMEHR